MDTQTQKTDEKIVTFMLKDDPQVYSLEFSFNELCDAEKPTGLNLMHALAAGDVTAAQTRALLYVCLKTHHPIVMLKEAGELLSREYSVVLEALSTVIADWRQRGLAEEEQEQDEGGFGAANGGMVEKSAPVLVGE